PELLAETRARGAPHLLEFTADWCINCKVLERTVYRATSVANAVQRAGMVPIHVDATESHPTRDALLGQVGGQALPFAAVVDGNGEIVARFTGLFEADSLIKAIDGAMPLQQTEPQH